MEEATDGDELCLEPLPKDLHLPRALLAGHDVDLGGKRLACHGAVLPGELPAVGVGNLHGKGTGDAGRFAG